MRARRIENEWHLLESLRQSNSDRLQLARDGDHFALEVDGLPALVRAPGDGGTAEEAISSHHSLRIIFPRYYPTMPAEVYLRATVFHPNVNPDTGFVCLWTKHHVETTLERTLAQLQRVLAWVLVNADPEHVMQRDALLWFTQRVSRIHLPLDFIPFTPVYPHAWDFGAPPLRRRLS